MSAFCVSAYGRLENPGFSGARGRDSPGPPDSQHPGAGVSCRVRQLMNAGAGAHLSTEAANAATPEVGPAAVTAASGGDERIPAKSWAAPCTSSGAAITNDISISFDEIKRR